MKKGLFLLTVALGAMLFVTSCQKDEAIDTMTPESVVTYSMGCNLMPADQFAALEKAETPNLKVLPTSVNLVVPPVGNQGGEGSCVAWGTTYAGRSTSYQNTNGGSYNFGVNIFSPEYVYNQIKVTTCAGGAYTSDGLDLLVDQGVCTWNSMPYTDVDCDDMPNSTQLAEAANYKISSYAAVAINVDAIKAQLAAGKILVVAGSVYGAYMSLGYDQVITTYKGRVYGGHCYACVGYDDAKQAFKFMNSWGTSWATDGFGWMGYNVIGAYWREAWIINE
jgi:C1A family cysteine protease